MCGCEVRAREGVLPSPPLGIGAGRLLATSSQGAKSESGHGLGRCRGKQFEKKTNPLAYFVFFPIGEGREGLAGVVERDV